MDGCSASIRFWMPTSVIPTCVAALAGKSIKTVWPFPATIISLSPAGKCQQRMNYMMSVRHMALICEQRHAPDFPRFSGELTYEQYYGDKVDLLGNGTLSRNPRAAGAALVWNPVPLLEVRAGYRDAGNGGSQAEGGLRVNYSFGTPLHEQLDYRNVGAPSNTTNRRAFVDRNYDIVMAYREQASKIRITAMPVSGLSGTLVTLMATVDSRYPVEKVEWSGDAELLAGLQLQGSLGSGLILPQLPLTATDGQEYSLYLTVTDSRGTRVTSERIPVRVTQDETSFRSPDKCYQ